MSTEERQGRPETREGLPGLVKRALGAKSIHMAVWIGAGGLAFTGANLILAGILDADAYGRLALYEAVLSVCSGLAPLGLDSLVVRREVRVARESILWFLGTGLLAGLAGLVVTRTVYTFPAAIGLLLAGTCVAASTNDLFSSGARAKMRFTWAQVLFQLPNFVFVAGAGALALAGGGTWVHGAVALALGYAAAASLGYLRHAVNSGDASDSALSDDAGGGWRIATKAASFVGIGGAVLVLAQIEKFVIAEYMTMEQVGTFAVAAMIVGSPYRLLERGVGYVLMPRLRATSDVGARRDQVRKELTLVGGLGLLGGVLLVVGAEPLIRLVYGTKYDVSLPLILVLVIVGIVRLLFEVASSALSGLGERGQLGAFAAATWLGLGVAFGAAVSLTGAGLPGVVVGAGLGWLLGAVAGGALVLTHFRDDG